MKKVLTLFLLIQAVLFFSTCSNDFELNAPAKDVPVVYAFLSTQDKEHYVRIERAFLPDNQSALELAKDPNELYYDNLDVKIEELDDNGGVSRSFTLNEVNGADEGLPRDMGVFADDPNILYKFETQGTDTLIGGKTYRIVINRGDNLDPVTAEEVIVSPISRFTGPADQGSLNIIYGPEPITPKVVWRSKIDAHIYDLNIRYHIQEWNINDPNNRTDITITGTLESNIRVNTPSNPNTTLVAVSSDYEPSTFYGILLSNLEPDPNIHRELISYDFVAVGVGSEYERFQEVSQANTGLTSAQLVNRYTNVNGGIGLFTSRTIGVYPGFTLKPESRDSLRNGFITGDLGFQ